MAFPVNGVLDNFDRANGAVGAAWSKIWSGDNDLQITSNQVTAVSAAWSNNGWNATTFGADCEAYIDIPTAFNSTINVYARMSALNTAGGPNGYRVRYDGASTVYIERLDAGTPATLGATISASFASGDKIGIECVGSTITAYKYTGGSWAALDSRTDATYGAAGYIGVECFSTGYRLDNFGGGAIAAGTSVQLATRARNDDGSESAATTIADGNFTAPLDTNARVRFQINTTGDAAATQYQLEAQKSGDLTWAKV